MKIWTTSKPDSREENAGKKEITSPSDIAEPVDELTYFQRTVEEGLATCIQHAHLCQKLSGDHNWDITKTIKARLTDPLQDMIESKKLEPGDQYPAEAEMAWDDFHSMEMGPKVFLEIMKKIIVLSKPELLITLGEKPKEYPLNDPIYIVTVELAA